MLLLALHLVWAALASATCYEPSVAHPLPEYDADDVLLKRVFAFIDTALTTTAAAPEYASTSFSVEVTSSKESLWSYHHTARVRNASRHDIPEVNGDALYRIASITKSFTVLGVLYQHVAGILSLDDSIDTYIEELKGEQEGTIPWKDITLRSLASQLSGIPSDFIPPGDKKCYTFADLMKSVKSRAPVFAPNQKSTYSNLAFELLGLAIENATNQTYESYINDAIFKPLNMTKSSLSKPPDSAGIIPFEPHYWGIDVGIQSPTGGIYSSTTDLSKYLRYILTHYNGITSAANWAHPASPSRGLNSFYGMPWEIYQTDRILQKSRRTVRFITKAGGLPGYSSIIITVPEYDLGITILVAANNDILGKIQELVTVEVVRAAEQIAIQQLQKRYAGTFASAEPDLNSSVALVADHRGLVVFEFISNSTDFTNSDLMKYIGAPRDGRYYVQLVPTLLHRDEKAKLGELWRFVVTAERKDGYRDIWDDFCITNIESPTYANVPINEVAFWDGKGKAFDTLELSAFRTNLSRTDDRKTELRPEYQNVLEL